MLPLYAARIEDLGLDDFVKVDCAACHHVALLTPGNLLRVGLSPAAKLLDFKGRFRSSVEKRQRRWSLVTMPLEMSRSNPDRRPR